MSLVGNAGRLQDEDVAAPHVLEELDHHLAVREPADDASSKADVEMATDGFGELGVRVAGEDSHPLKGHLPEPRGGRARGQIDGVALSHRNSRPMASLPLARRPTGRARCGEAKRTPALIHSLAMSALASRRGLTLPDMEVILAVTSKLAAPFDLMTMLSEVVNAAKQVLHADRGSVWLYDCRGGRAGARDRDRHCAGARSRQRRDRRRVRARTPDHQRARLLQGRALQPRRRSRLRLSDSLHAGAAAHRPQGSAGGSDAGAEQGGRRLQTRTTRPWRRRSPPNAPWRCSACG